MRVDTKEAIIKLLDSARKKLRKVLRLKRNVMFTLNS